jgi:hypothetical protein
MLAPRSSSRGAAVFPMPKKMPCRAAVHTSADDQFREVPLRFRIASPSNDKDEAVVTFYFEKPEGVPQRLSKKTLEWAAKQTWGAPKFAEYMPLLLVLTRRSCPDFLPLDVLPPPLRAAVMSLSRAIRRGRPIRRRRRGRDRTIAHFIQKRTPFGCKQEAIVKEAADHFGLSRSAIFRALARDKRRYPQLWIQGGFNIRVEIDINGINITSFRKSRLIGI